jgi:hypothetical protein
MFSRRGLAVVCPARPEHTMQEALHEQFTNLIEQGAFDRLRRYVTSTDQDDRMAEAIGQTWAMAARKAELGIKMDNALIVHAVKLRAIDHRRQLPRGGQPRRDALHFSNFVDGKVEIHRIDGLLDDDGNFTRECDNLLQVAWLAATSLDPADQLASAIDIDAWLTSLDDADRELLAGRLAGFSLQELASRTNRSITSVFTRLRDLGGDLATFAGIVVKKKKRKPRSRTVAVSC